MTNLKTYAVMIFGLMLVGLMLLLYGHDFLLRFGVFEIAVVIIPALLLALLRLLSYPRMNREMKFVFMAVTVYTGIALAIFGFITLFFGSPWGLLVGGAFLGYEAIPLVALYLTARGQHDSALNYVNQVMRFFPASARLYGVRGMVRSYQKDDAGAVDDYSEAITRLKARKSPRDRVTLARYYAGRLEALLKLRDYHHALEDAETVIRMQPDGTYGYAQRAVALLYLDETTEALDDIEHALHINKEPAWNGTLYNTRGLMKYVLNEYEAALADYALALDTPASPDTVKLLHPIALSNQGVVYFTKHDYAAALACFNRGKAIDPDSLHARAGLAITRYALGSQDEACQIWRSLAASEPDFNDAASVRQKYYKWTPAMADVAQNIITVLQTV